MRLIPALLMAVVTAVPAHSAELAVWPIDALIKVFPQDALGTSRVAPQAWLAPRNGHTSVQFAVRSATAIKRLNIRVTIEGGLEVVVRHAGYVPVSSNPPNTPADELLRPAPAFFPDPLLENFPYELPASRTDSIWLTVYAPATAKPGVYRGRAVFETETVEAGVQDFQIRVAEGLVPAEQTLRVTNWLNASPEHLLQALGRRRRVLAGAGQHRRRDGRA
ncbi:MAG TPA: hypothetical protein VL135_01260 [Terracidiphilus sp.]|jgi:hypothetical protein|nr:hypothetical protein [Terracidiphilus sp.]